MLVASHAGSFFSEKENSQYLILKMDACGLLCNGAKKDALQACHRHRLSDSRC
jgi:hypothetical protein